jgi:hypothetical protein
VLIGPRPELDFLNVRAFLMRLGGMGLLIKFIFILPEIHNLADRRLRGRRHFHKIVPQLLRFF